MDAIAERNAQRIEYNKQLIRKELQRLIPIMISQATRLAQRERPVRVYRRFRPSKRDLRFHYRQQDSDKPSPEMELREFVKEEALMLLQQHGSALEVDFTPYYPGWHNNLTLHLPGH